MTIENATGRRFGVELEVACLGVDSAAHTVAELLGGRRRPLATGGYEIVRYVPTDDPYAFAVAGATTSDDGRWMLPVAEPRWTVVHDGSVPGGAEVVSPPLAWPAGLDEVDLVVRALRAAGAHRSPACGLHVHVDGAGHTGASLRNLLRLARRYEALCFAGLRTQPARQARYCKPVDRERLARFEALDHAALAEPSGLRLARHAWFGDERLATSKYDPSRYAAVNLNSFFYRGTVEFRWAEGAVDCRDVRLAVHLAIALDARARQVSSSRARSSEQSDLRSSAYARARAMLFHLGFVGAAWAKVRERFLAPVRPAALAATIEVRLGDQAELVTVPGGYTPPDL